VILYCKKGGEKRFLEPLLKYFADLPISKIDQAAIDAAAMALYPKGSSSTRNRQVYTPISAVLKSAGLKMPLQRLENPDGVVRWLRHDEATRLIASCSPHLRPMVMFMLYTGARAGEALWLDWRDGRMEPRAGCQCIGTSFPNWRTCHIGPARSFGVRMVSHIQSPLVIMIVQRDRRSRLVSRELALGPGSRISAFMIAGTHGQRGITKSIGIFAHCKFSADGRPSAWSQGMLIQMWTIIGRA
jgi:hypothetical protein